MTPEEFKAEVQAVIDRADINQWDAQLVLEDLAKEQRDEWDDRETA